MWPYFDVLWWWEGNQECNSEGKLPSALDLCWTLKAQSGLRDLRAETNICHIPEPMLIEHVLSQNYLHSRIQSGKGYNGLFFYTRHDIIPHTTMGSWTSEHMWYMLLSPSEYYHQGSHGGIIILVGEFNFCGGNYSITTGHNLYYTLWDIQ